jgi:hypothetical protein
LLCIFLKLFSPISLDLLLLLSVLGASEDSFGEVRTY